LFHQPDLWNHNRMKITYYGHSCFGVEVQGKHLLFDPFISPNPLASGIDVNAVPADFILVSHGHFDHVADLVSIAQRTNATVICSWEIHEWLQKQGIRNTRPMNIEARYPQYTSDEHRREMDDRFRQSEMRSGGTLEQPA
jgi:L-ascorbate metabolism protein UlaG (beta-lactamase superfamily)